MIKRVLVRGLKHRSIQILNDCPDIHQTFTFFSACSQKIYMLPHFTSQSENCQGEIAFEFPQNENRKVE